MDFFERLNFGLKAHRLLFLCFKRTLYLYLLRFITFVFFLMDLLKRLNFGLETQNLLLLCSEIAFNTFLLTVIVLTFRIE